MAKKQPRQFTSIGGQALIEGIMMRGPKKSAMAVRHTSGEIKESVWDTEAAPKVAKIPIVRGVVNFVLSMLAGYRCMMRSVEMSGLEEEITAEENAAKELTVTETAQSAEESAEESAAATAAVSVDVTDGTTPAAAAEAAASVAAEIAEEAAVQDAPAPAENAPKTEEKGKESSPLMTALMVISAVLGVGLAVVLFMWLPTLLSGWLRGLFPALNGDDWYARLFRGGFEGVLKIALFVGYVAAVSLMKDIRRVFQYHGAEHKTIFCYEAGLPLTVENVRAQKRFHPRCGTSFMILMLLVGILVSMLIPADINTALRTALKVLSIPLIMGIGYELLKFAGKHDNLFTRILSAPGIWVQRLTTKEPEDEMIECAIAAMNRVIPENQPQAEQENA